VIALKIIVLPGQFWIILLAGITIFLARKCRVLVQSRNRCWCIELLLWPERQTTTKCIERIPNTFLFCGELVSFGLFR